MSDPGEVFCRLASMDFAGILAERHIQRPVEFILDKPMLAGRFGELLGAQLSRADVVADHRGFWHLIAFLAETHHHAYRFQSRPFIAKLLKFFSNFADNMVSSLLPAPVLLISDIGVTLEAGHLGHGKRGLEGAC